MIIGIGCDIIEIARVQKAVQRQAFQNRVFSVEEIAYCTGRGQQQYASFAARFAAKEAVLKAFGTGFRGGSLTEIEVYNDALGRPEIKFSGYYKELAEKSGVTKCHLSLTHSRDNAAAYVVMEG